MTCFRIILEHPMGDLQNIANYEESEKIQEKIPQWMCKKWAAQIVNQIFIRYYHSFTVVNKKPLARKCFQKNWAVEYFKIIIQQVFQAKEKFIPDFLLNYYLKYTCQSVGFPQTFRLLDRNSISHLMLNVSIPILYRVKSEEELWKNNPIEYIRKDINFRNDNLNSLKSTAINLLLILCQKGMLVKFVKFIMRELQHSTDLVRKEAILLILRFLRMQIMNSSIGDHIETIIDGLVFPEFTSQIGFLRSRAVLVYTKYICFPFKHLKLGLEAVCKLLQDPELPVRYEALLALSKIVKYKEFRDCLSLDIKNLMEMCIKFLYDIQLDEIVRVLKRLISAFSEEIISFAPELTLNLCRAFNQMGKKINMDDLTLGQIDILNVIEKVINVLIYNPEDLVKISFILSPLFEYCLGGDGSDFYFEDILFLLSDILYYAPDNSMPHLYYLTNYLYNSIAEKGRVERFTNKGVDKALSSIANFIKKYKGQTLENLPRILEIAFTLLKRNQKVAIFGCNILIYILENYKFSLNSYLPSILSEISGAFTAGSKKLKICCSQATHLALWNSTLLTLSAEPLISSALLFSLVNLKDYKTIIEISHLMYGFGSLFFVKPHLSQQMCSILPVIFQAIAQLYTYTQSMKRIDDDLVFGIGIDPQYQKMIMEIRAIESGDGEKNHSLDRGAVELYDSPFKIVNHKKLIEEIAQTLDCPQVMISINELLTKKQVQNRNSFFNIE